MLKLDRKVENALKIKINTESYDIEFDESTKMKERSKNNVAQYHKRKAKSRKAYPTPSSIMKHRNKNNKAGGGSVN